MPVNAQLSPPTGKLGYKGVYLASKGAKKPYRAQITHPKNGLKVWIGTFETVEEAAHAYDEVAWKLYGANCYFNFLQVPQPTNES